ncbi:hypothetical protein PIB30_100038 [Stylosanthes scabra]|uniref:Legume lectin domain-containing protein n=1 Tax=Stylosanthes scabra TaxID=79078 RepID=A0ABU6QZJ6_9FABA|nr:hypothetical protein [Stylosanthes scabra]
MAISTKNLLPPFFFIAIFLALLNTSTSTDSISFSFINFTPGERNLILQGDAEISPVDNEIKLTKTNSTGQPVPNTVGRVLHLAEVHLWEETTNRLASFETQFSIYLRGNRGEYPADGLAFFIAPSDTTIPPGSAGGTLGLFDPNTALNSSANQVVAVEFDNFVGNDWDPSYQHIGIDVNSIRSSTDTRWTHLAGEILNVVISYDPNMKTLAVVANYPFGGPYQLSRVIDLRSVLPEWVRVGFSAASGQLYQTHNLVSWSFTSSLLSTAQKENDEFIKLARAE